MFCVFCYIPFFFLLRNYSLPLFMDIIQNILSDKRAAPKIKSNSIILLAKCNRKKPKEILEALNLCRELNTEIIDDVLHKLKEIKEYETILLNIPEEKEPEPPQINIPIRRKITETLGDEDQDELSHKKLNQSIKQIKIGNSFLSTYLFFLNHPLQCRVCGFRFAGDLDGKTRLCLHLDEHTKRDKLMLDAKAISQEYFLTFDQFLCKVSRIEFDEIKKEDQFIVAQNAVCEICKERIEMQWSDEKNNWVLINFVAIGEEGFCHRKCII